MLRMLDELNWEAIGVAIGLGTVWGAIIISTYFMLCQ
jgi:uncharacterized membrane protein YhiD involved in acid resistance